MHVVGDGDLGYTLNIKHLPFMAIIKTDVSGKVVYINKCFEKMSGYTLEEIIGKKIGKESKLLYSGYHSADFYKNMWDTIKSGKTFSAEISNINKSGEVYWQLINIVPDVVDNVPVSFVAFLLDVTDSRKSVLKHNAVLEALTDIILLYDNNRVIVEMFPESVIRKVEPRLLDKIGQTSIENDLCSDDVADDINYAFDMIDSNSSSDFYITRNVYFDTSVKGKQLFEVIFKRYNRTWYIGTYRNITDRHLKMEKEIGVQGVTDALNKLESIKVGNIIRRIESGEKISYGITK